MRVTAYIPLASRALKEKPMAPSNDELFAELEALKTRCDQLKGGQAIALELAAQLCVSIIEGSDRPTEALQELEQRVAVLLSKPLAFAPEGCAEDPKVQAIAKEIHKAFFDKLRSSTPGP